jgi:hypothetical protein
MARGQRDSEGAALKRSTSKQYLAKLDLARRIIEASGGISVRKLGEVMGETRFNAWKIVRELRVYGHVNFSEELEDRGGRRQEGVSR